MRNRVSHSETSHRYLVQSLAHGLAVLERFGEGTRGHTLTDLVRSLQSTKATVFRHVATLVALGYLELDPETRRYRPTLKVLRLGAAYLGSLTVPELAQPSLERLAERFGESANVAVLDEGEVVYVARIAGRRILSTNLAVGSRLPAHCTSMGKVLLAYLPEERLRTLLPRLDLRPLTPRTVTRPARLRQVLRAIRARGWAVNDQEMDLGLRSCAAPIFDRTGAAVAAVNVSVSSARVGLAELEAEYVPAVVEAAREITAAWKRRL